MMPNTRSSRYARGPLASLVGLLALVAAPGAPAVEVSLDFEGCPAEVTGQAGEVKTFEVLVALTTSSNDLGVGAQGWSISLTADGGRIQDISLDGLLVQTSFDSDGNPATPPISPFPLALPDASFPDAQLATMPGGSQGAVSVVVLSSSTLKSTLLAEGTARIARLTVQTTVPDGAGAVTLRFQDGFQGSGLPIKNYINFEGINHVPALGTCAIPVRSLASATLSFEGYPAGLHGAPGEVKSFDVYAVLTTEGNGLGVGAQGWSTSLTADGGAITDIQVDGIVVQTVYDGDGNPATPPVDPYPFDLADSSFADPELATRPSNGKAGAVSVVVLSSSQKKVTLEPEGTVRIARLTVQATIPPPDSPTTLTLRYENGFVGTGQPIKNYVNFEGVNSVPVLGSASVTLDSLPGTALSFDDCPADAQGEPGETRSFDVFADLATSDNALGVGAEGWSISLTAEGGTIEEISADGILAPTVYDDDGDPATPPQEVSFDLGQASFVEAQLAHRPSDGKAGAISVVVLSSSARKRTLAVEGSTHIARLKLTANVPAAASTQVSLSYEDGFQGEGLPIKNYVNFEGLNAHPSLSSCSFQLQPGAAAGHWKRCDSDGSGLNDITDAIVTLNFLFVGLDVAPPCLQALDCDASGKVDISDPIADLSWLFLGGAKPPEPYDACGTLHANAGGTGAICEYDDAAGKCPQ